MTSPDLETNLIGPKDPRAVNWERYREAHKRAFQDQVEQALAKTSAELQATTVNIQPIGASGLRASLTRFFRRRAI